MKTKLFNNFKDLMYYEDDLEKKWTYEDELNDKLIWNIWEAWLLGFQILAFYFLKKKHHNSNNELDSIEDVFEYVKKMLIEKKLKIKINYWFINEYFENKWENKKIDKEIIIYYWDNEKEIDKILNELRKRYIFLYKHDTNFFRQFRDYWILLTIPENEFIF